MFTGFSQSTLDFMWGIRMNNERPWFEAHKAEYIRDFQGPMRALASDVFDRVTAECGDRGFTQKVSRIYRDARRVRDGRPYRDHMWCSVERPNEDGAGTPVFWFELTPDNWSHGMGFYMARPETMAKMRARIRNNTESFESLIAPLAAQDYFRLGGEDYARKKEAPSENVAEWYNKKSFFVIHEESHAPILFSAALVERIVEGIKFLMPLYDYCATLNADPAPTDDGK